MFIASLIILAKRLETNIHQCINKLWYRHTKKYFSAIKRNEVLVDATTWMNLKNLMRSERRQTQKVIYCSIPFIWNIQNKPIHRKQISGGPWLGGGEIRSNCLMDKGFYFVPMKMFWSSVELVVAQHWKCTKCHWILLSKMINMLSEFHLNFFLTYLFIYFWLRWVFVAVRRFSLVAVSGGYSSLRCTGFSLRWLLLLRSTGARRAGFSSCGTWAP